MGPGDDIFRILTQPALYLPLFVLVLCRVSGLMLTAPIYGSQTIPTRIRAALAVAISVSVFPVVIYRLPAGLSLGQALPGVIGELLIGLIMGLSLSVIFAGVELAGMVVGQQAGLSLGEVYNPVLDTNSTILGQVFFLVAMTIFVLAGGHRELLRALLETYDSVPVMSFRVGPSVVDLVTGLLTGAFTLALRLAAPALIALLMATLVMGFLSRTIPQLNILSVGFAVRGLVALAMAGFSLAAAEALLSGALADTLDSIRGAFGLN